MISLLPQISGAAPTCAGGSRSRTLVLAVVARGLRVLTPHGTVFYVAAAVGELGTVRPRAAQLRLLPSSWIAWPDPVCPAVGRRATKLEIERMVGDQGVRRPP